MKMNIHSQWSDMSVTTPFPNRRSADDSRRERILEAAERAFVRHGFHAATMSHVAEEAEMSAGNLYRYFPSKEAIVEALCALDQEGRDRRVRRTAGAERRHRHSRLRGAARPCAQEDRRKRRA